MIDELACSNPNNKQLFEDQADKTTPSEKEKKKEKKETT